MEPAGLNYLYTLNNMKDRYHQDAHKIVCLLFVQPNKTLVQTEILSNLGYANMRSGSDIDFFFVGYSASKTCDPDEVTIQAHSGVNWYYIPIMFVKFVNEIEKQSTWKYSGETELFITEFAHEKLCYNKVISIWLDRAVHEELIYSVSNLFEDIYRVVQNKKESSVLKPMRDFIDKTFRGTIKSSAIYAIKNYSK